MNLVWKLLRQHISIPQFAGFFLANLIGMLIILLGVQFYTDTQSIYNSEDSFLKDDYLIVNKRVSLTGATSSFSQEDMDDLAAQPFIERVGAFIPSKFKVKAAFAIDGVPAFSTDMFFESVPDEFVDVKSKKWHFDEQSTTIPNILPRSYLDLYNFGFAQTQNLATLNEGAFSLAKLQVQLEGNGIKLQLEGRIEGFSGRINTILVPESFIQWANEHFSDPNTPEKGATRLIMQVNNPTDENLARYLTQHHYITDQDKLDSSKTNFILRVIVGIVMGVGIIISILAFYILMLSVYLLVEKNNTKLENLLLIGYSPTRVARPYQMLTVGLNILVLILALVILFFLRGIYLDMFKGMFPRMEIPSMMPAVLVGLGLLLLVSILNIVAVRTKIMSIWKRKN